MPGIFAFHLADMADALHVGLLAAHEDNHRAMLENWRTSEWYALHDLSRRLHALSGDGENEVPATPEAAQDLGAITGYIYALSDSIRRYDEVPRAKDFACALESMAEIVGSYGVTVRRLSVGLDD